MKHTWIWCLCNTILIGLVALMITINDDCESAQDQTIRDLMTEVHTLEKCQQVKDTVIVNVNTNVKVPSHFSAEITYPDEGSWVGDAE